MHGEVQLPRAGAGGLQGKELSSVCQRLLDAERSNGLVEGRDYGIDLQRGKRPNHADQDAAPNNLIRFVEQGVWSRATFGAFHRLLNNYTRSTGVAEVVTPEKEREISNFLDGVLQSAPMQAAHGFLASKDLVARDPARFKAQLYQMWFRLYTRETRDDTCGFEHVFVGESKNGEITGLHNWLQFYNLEQSRSLDYRGYIFPRRRAGGAEDTVTPTDLMVSVQFNVDGQVKDVSSLWLGTSPEFELALYTLCFVAAGEKSVIELSDRTGTYDIEIRCYHIRSKYGDKVGSAFPVLLSKQPGGEHQQGWQPQAAHAAPVHAQQPPWQPASGQQPAWTAQQPQPPPPQQQQQQPDSANQGCGGLIADLLKSIFSRK